MNDADRWMLSVDFGTMNTAAAVCPAGRPDRARVVTLSTGNALTMPSGVLRATDGAFTVGEDARHAMAAAPVGTYEGSPKRRIGEPVLMLGAARCEVADVIAAVLEVVAARASRQFNGTAPSSVRMTCPAAWATPRRRVLLEAAERAGLPSVVLVPEPVAAAAYYVARDGAPPGPVAVFDLGAGTLDVAVVQSVDEGFKTLATGGVDPLGGDLFDERLLAHVRAALAARGRQDLWALLEEHRDRAAWRTFLDALRHTKHALTETTSTDLVVAVADDAEVVRVTRDEFEAAIVDLLERAVGVLREVLASSGVEAAQLGALYLVGGSAFVPAVHRLISDALGRPPATFDDPKLVTCLGALLPTARDVDEPGPSAGASLRSTPPPPPPPSGQPSLAPPAPLSEAPGPTVAEDRANLATFAQMTVAELRDAVGALPLEQRRAVLEHERAHRNRKTAVATLEAALRPAVEAIDGGPSWRSHSSARFYRPRIDESERQRLLDIVATAEPLELRRRLEQALGPSPRRFVTRTHELAVWNVLVCVTPRGVGRLAAAVQANARFAGEAVYDSLLFLDRIHSVWLDRIGLRINADFHQPAWRDRLSGTQPASLVVRGSRAALREVSLGLRAAYEERFAVAAVPASSTS